jgi:hypothetical protein
LGRLSWRLANVVEVRPETDRVVTLALEVPDWDGHLPGQHVDVRLTAEDGYRAERAYSIASSPDGGRIELAVGRRGDRVAPLGLVAVLGGEAQVDVLAGQVAVPAGHVEGQAGDPRGLRPDVGDACEPPAQSPQ